MKIKKLIISVLTALTFLSLTACGGGSSSQTPPPEIPPETGIPTDWFTACDGAEVSIYESGEYIRDGGDGWSLQYKHTNTMSVNIGAGVKFKESSAQDMGDFTFYVYNAATTDCKIEVFCHANTHAAIFQDYKEVAEYTATAGEWTEVNVNGRTLANVSFNGTYDVIGISVQEDTNGGKESAQFKSVELYFDGLGVFLPQIEEE